MKRVFENRKTLYLILGIVLVCVFSLTIVYAALNTVLKITGNAEVVASSWDIHLDNVNVKNGSVGGVAPKITSATTATFSAKLTIPGDFYEFSIDVVNNGTIDAMIDGVSKSPALTESQAKYLNYIVEYENGNTISTRQLVEAGSFVRLKVRVEYRKDLVASDLPTTNDNLTLSFTVNYVQSDDTGNAVLNNGTLKAMVKSGTGTDVGDEICIGNECFYVISSTDNDVTMLAKYNLHVGYMKDENDSAVSLVNPTGIQDESSNGWFNDTSSDNPMIGIQPFSSTNYWSNTVTNYPAYVYNENSYVYDYIENYKNYLESLGTYVKEARLIMIEELIELGCNIAANKCPDAPSWVNLRTYWTGNAYSSTELYRVMTDNTYLMIRSYTSNSTGVRPVITISKSQILGIKNKIKPVANGSLDEIGTVVTIGNEQFYTIGTEGDNVKLLAKYNLLVGNKYDDTNGAVPLENSTGIQDERAIGLFIGYSVDNPLIGTKPFSSTNYWKDTVNEYLTYVYNENSYLYEYIEKYKDYLEGFGTIINEARLIKNEELESLGCVRETYSCLEAPKWVYATTYWTGTFSSSMTIFHVHSEGGFGPNTYTYSERSGVRPVIVIPKSEFN